MITCVVIADTQTWIIIIVGVILVYKELTTSVVPNVRTIITSHMVTYWWLIDFTQCMLRFAFRFRCEIPSGINHICLNLVIHMDMWSLHLSTTEIDNFCTANAISNRKEIPPLENSWVSAWTLVLQYLLFVSPPRCSQFRFQKKTGVGIAYEYLPIIEQDHFYLDYTLCLSSVRVLITLCHGHGLWIWITWKVFSI